MRVCQVVSGGDGCCVPKLYPIYICTCNILSIHVNIPLLVRVGFHK